MNDRAREALDEQLLHELNNALMIVLSSAEVIDRCAGGDPRVHDAVARIRVAVDRSREAVAGASHELGEIAGRLSRR